MKNYYAVLDLPRTVTAEQLRIRYKQLIRIYHPDRFQNRTDKVYAEARLKEINQAYSAVAEAIKQRHFPECDIPAPPPGAPTKQAASTAPIKAVRAIIPLKQRRRVERMLVAGGIVLAGLTVTSQFSSPHVAFNHLQRVVSVGLDGQGMEAQTQQVTARQAPVDWVPITSPSGRHMVFILRQATMEKLYLRDLQSGRLRQVMLDSIQGDSLVWSPDENKLAFVAGDGDDSQLHVLDLPTGQVE